MPSLALINPKGKFYRIKLKSKELGTHFNVSTQYYILYLDNNLTSMYNKSLASGNFTCLILIVMIEDNVYPKVVFHQDRFFDK